MDSKPIKLGLLINAVGNEEVFLLFGGQVKVSGSIPSGRYFIIAQSIVNTQPHMFGEEKRGA